MRLQRYLLEKFAGAGKFRGRIFEVFKNPDNKEMKELEGAPGYRFIIDVVKKDIYLTTSELIHRDVIDAIQPQLEDLSYKPFYQHGVGMDRYILGSTEDDTFDFITSDMYNFVRDYDDVDVLKEILANLEEVATYNINWVSKWITPSKIEKLVDNTIKSIKISIINASER